MPDTTIPTPAADLRAFLAVPPVGAGPWPAVVVVHDAVGLSDVAREHAERLAAAGYLAVVPDLYSRGGRMRCVQGVFRALAAGEGEAFNDIDRVRSWVAGRDDCSGKVGIVGFCMGGGFALAAAGRGFDVSAPNYGGLPKDLDVVLAQPCPIVASYGRRDPTLRGSAARLEAFLSAKGVAHDVKEYPEAGHSFMDRFGGPLGPVMRATGFGFHQPSAEDAWGRILRFFDAHLR